MTMNRRATCERQTGETTVKVELVLDHASTPAIRTGLGFLDHMLTALAVHGRFGLGLTCVGDLEVDDHHTVEDCALVLGAAFDEALGDRAGIARFGHAYAPLDEALARVVVDLGGRSHATVELGLRRERIGEVATENLTHFFRSFAAASRCALHVDVLRGDNDHHRIEAAFKAMALSLRGAVDPIEGLEGVRSSKGVL